MIVRYLPLKGRRSELTATRDAVLTLSRYVVDARPWSELERAPDLTHERIRSLREYAMAMRDEGVEPGEKIEHTGTRNLLTRNFRDQQIEMLAAAALAPQVKMPMVHIIISWQEGEVPSSAQLEETVDITLRTVGLERCLTIFADHTNTSNRHLHAAVLRIDPATGQAAGSAFPIEDAHQAMALVQDHQGWRPEPSGRYYVVDGAVHDTTSDVLVRDARGRLAVGKGDRAAARAARDGGIVKDAIAVKQDAILAAAEAAISWSDFHQRLAVMDVIYHRAGSGARLRVGNAEAAASAVGRGLTLTVLEGRWREYHGGAGAAHELERYNRLVIDQKARLRSARDATLKLLGQQLTTNLEKAKDEGRSPVELRAERDAAAKAVRPVYMEAIKRCTAQRSRNVADWERQGRPAVPKPITGPILLFEQQNVDRRPTPLRALHTRTYDTTAQHMDGADGRIFSDLRLVIVVHRPDRQKALDAALSHAARRWDIVKVIGTEDSRQACAERAAALSIEVVDHDGKAITLRAEIPATTDQKLGDQRRYPSVNEEFHHVRSIRPDHRSIDQAVRISVAAYQPYSGEIQSLAATRSLASVRGLSSIAMVRDRSGAPVLLLDLQRARLVQGLGGGGDGVRRPGVGDRSDEQRRDSRLNVAEAVPVPPSVNGALRPVPDKPVSLIASRSRREQRDAISAPPIDRDLPDGRPDPQLTAPHRRDDHRIHPSDNSSQRKPITADRTDVIAKLGAMRFLSLRSIQDDDTGPSRARSFEIVPEESLKKDEALLRGVIAFQRDEDVQRLLSRRWQAMLAELRQRLHAIRLPERDSTPKAWLAGTEPRFQAAVSCALRDDEVREVIAIAKVRWEKAHALEAVRIKIALHPQVEAIPRPDRRRLLDAVEQIIGAIEAERLWLTIEGNDIRVRATDTGAAEILAMIDKVGLLDIPRRFAESMTHFNEPSAKWITSTFVEKWDHDWLLAILDRIQKGKSR